MRNALLATFENQPALLTLGAEQRFESFLGEASGVMARIEAHNDNNLVMADDFWFSADDWRSSYRPYVVKNGVLIIPVKGVLLHGVGYQLGNWATGYTYLAKALERGLADPEVKGIAWVCDSPGGHVAGNFELVDRIFAARDVKPQRAYAFEGAYSAAYSIASATNRITVSRSGGVGSIGVLRVHYDYSAALEKEGVVVTFTQFGKHKTDGTSLKALPADVQARWQAQVDELGEEFVSIVARNRAMEAQAVRDTEALCFSAKEATSNGLADDIGSLDDAIAVFAADMSNQEDDTMTTTDKAATFDQAAVDNARTEGFAAGKAEGVKDGSRAEKDRRATILSSPEAKDRPAAAAAAIDTEMAATDAIAFIGKLPKEVATAPVAVDPNAPKGTVGAAADFVATMNAADAPNLGAPAAKTADEARLQRRRDAASGAGRLKVVESK